MNDERRGVIALVSIVFLASFAAMPHAIIALFKSPLPVPLAGIALLIVFVVSALAILISLYDYINRGLK